MSLVALTGTAAVPQEGDNRGSSILRDSQLRCRRRLLANYGGLGRLNVGRRHPRPKFLLPGHREGFDIRAWADVGCRSSKEIAFPAFAVAAVESSRPLYLRPCSW
jgi:hypothetical protein